MWENFDVVSARIKDYAYAPDGKFKTVRGLPALEENVEQKLRQYWADKTVPDSKKLEGFEYDLSKFDPKNISNREIRQISVALEEMGIIDRVTGTWLSATNLEFDRYGNEINIDKKVNLFKHYDFCLGVYEQEISAGLTFLTDVQTSLYTAISVVMALQERAKAPPSVSLIDTNA
ncbi:MAG: hypothetical protein JWP80_2060 [Pseudomonas sp.]|nr:hypothetical protein [Pseudomonas sp.]